MKEIVIPSKLYEYLETLSVIRKETPSDIVVNLILDLVDVRNRIKLLSEISDEYLSLGDELVNKGEMIVAGEMYWRGLIYLLRAVSLKLGFNIQNYQDYFSFVDYLAFKLNDENIASMYSNSAKLHGEYYSTPMEKEEFEFRVKELKNLVKKLKEVIQ